MTQPQAQPTLFEAPFFMEKPMPMGFSYKENFLTEAEEEQLLATFQTLPFENDEFNGYTARRRVIGFGRHGPLPAFLTSCITRAEAFANLPVGTITSALISEYSPGTPIGWHRDKPYNYGHIIGISLAGACVFRLRKVDYKTPTQKWQRFSIPALPRSVYCMADESRSHWQHSIPPVQTLRYSITLRDFGHSTKS